MAVVGTDPKNWRRTNTVQVFSDAPDNPTAVAEIEQWAAERGFARSSEYWLGRARTEHGDVFRGLCFRITDQEIQRARERSEATAARTLAMSPEPARTD